MTLVFVRSIFRTSEQLLYEYLLLRERETLYEKEN